MNRIFCSTGAIIGKINGRDYDLLKHIVPRIACDGLEFMMYQSWHDQQEALLRALAPFETPVFHVTKGVGERVSLGQTEEACALFREDCRLAAAMGARLLVLHLWSGQASDQHIERNIAAYAPLREIAERCGLLLTVENVLCNTADPMTHMKALAEVYPDISFTFDTKMAAFHSQLDALYAPENAWLRERIVHYHVNDYAGGHMDWARMSAKPLGAGHVDLERFFAFIRESGYQGSFTYEATALNPDATVRYDEINASLGRIRAGAAKEE